MTTDDPQSTRSAPLVSVRDLGVRRAGRWIVRHVDLKVERGELVFVIGANGAGKSTCVKAALGLIDIDEGRSSGRPPWRSATSRSDWR